MLEARPAGRACPSSAPRKHADPVTSGQLEELFADWQQALWAIDFFKTRQPESVMRSFREIIHRAELDGREASLVRAMGIEVVRVPRAPRAAMSQGTLERLLGRQPVRRCRRGAEPPAPLKDCRRRSPSASGRFAPACSRSTMSPKHVRYMGESWRWAWEYGVGNRKLCWVHFVATSSPPRSR